jgi:transposase
MPAKSADIVVDKARWLIQFTELPSAEIALMVGVSKRTIERWRANLECYGSLYPPVIAKRGRPRALTREQEEVKV